MAGKNFSCNNVTAKRREADFYETPYSLTRLLMEKPMRDYGIDIPFHDILKIDSLTVLEPAAGNGAIAKVLKEYDIECTQRDLPYDFRQTKDEYDVIMTNPPYSLAKEFILHAKKLSRRFVVMLLPLAYLHGKERYDTIYCDNKFLLRSVYVFTRYPMLGEPLREDGKHSTGMMVYAWYIWDKKHSGEEPTIGWLDNNAFIKSKKDAQTE